MHQFIQDAIKGGWEPNQKAQVMLVPHKTETINYSVQIGDHATLDSKAWEAVGKTRGWKQANQILDEDTTAYTYPEYPIKMHAFIDHLIDGLSIEEALNKIK